MQHSWTILPDAQCSTHTWATPRCSFFIKRMLLHLLCVCLSVFVCKWCKYVGSRDVLNGWWAENNLQESLFSSSSTMERGSRALNSNHQARLLPSEPSCTILLPPCQMMSKTFPKQQIQLSLFQDRKSNLHSSLHQQCWVNYGISKHWCH